MVAEEEGRMTQLQRLVVEFKAEELIIRALYRSSLDGPNPSTVRRRRQVEDLARDGLRQALTALEGDAALVGCSGFTQREDFLVVDTKDARAIAEEGSAA
jgi:hypothetical protein